VAKGYSQIPGIDYTDSRYTSIRWLMALAVKEKMFIHQMDGWMDGLRRVEPLLIEAELLHAGLCLGLMCSPR
jgi:hypothetical protein